jgi:Protein of unknown function (DUF3089)
LARKFLYAFASLIVLVIAGGFALNIYQDELTEIAFVPTTNFERQAALETNIYDDTAMWFAGPAARANDPTKFRPVGASSDETPGPAAIFFVHPTTFISRDRWNMAMPDAQTDARTAIFLRGLASPFASAGQVWAFLTDKPEGSAALDGAFADILLAFDTFVAKQQADRPIILAGHSQGARHLIHLLQERVAGKPIAKRIAAAYVIGWPISVDHDLPQMGLPLCSGPDDVGCIITYQSFAEPADYKRILAAYSAIPGLDGQQRGGSAIACTNPLTGGRNEPAEAIANLGTLKPNIDNSAAELVEKAVPARCDENGFLLIGDPPEIGNLVFPGGNYHVYDIPLFWANIRFDALWRLREYLKR